MEGIDYMANINYTFIIPHKNIPELLKRCLDSIPRREDIQIIVVDDNSDPDKVDFEHFPGLNEPCVEVYFTKEGKGAGYARNIGLKYARGKWLLFADADDYFLSNVLDVVDEYLFEDSEIVYFKVESRCSDSNDISDRDLFFNELLDQYELNEEDKLKRIKYKFVVPWAKMIKRDLVVCNRVLFDEIKYSNDVMFSIYTASFAKSILVDMSKIYCVTSRNNSLINESGKDSFFIRYVVILRKNLYLRSIGDFQYQSHVIPLLVKAYNNYGIIAFMKALKLGITFKTDFIFEIKYYLCKLLNRIVIME